VPALAVRTWLISESVNARGAGRLWIGGLTMGRNKIKTDDPATMIAAELYRNGLTLKDAAATVYLSETGLRHRFQKSGVPLRETNRGKPISAELANRIRREYSSDKTYAQVARECGVCIRTVQKYSKMKGDK